MALLTDMCFFSMGLYDLRQRITGITKILNCEAGITGGSSNSNNNDDDSNNNNNINNNNKRKNKKKTKPLIFNWE
jgi:hypothetical protein